MLTRRAILKAAIYVFVLANIKSWPFAWHVRFYYILIKHFYWSRKSRPEELFQYKTYSSHTPLMEMDMNMHKSNSTYFSDLDHARSDLVIYLLRDFFKGFKKTQGVYPYVPVGSVQISFKKEIKAYIPYKIRSRVLGWEDKWFFVLSEFVQQDGQVAAIGLTKYVFKFKRRTIAPEEAIKMAGLGTEENLKQGRIEFEKIKQILELDDALVTITNGK